MKLYSVAVPVCSSVIVYVEAENADMAEEIACLSANISDAEPIDVSPEGAEVLEISESDLPEHAKVYVGQGKIRRHR